MNDMGTRISTLWIVVMLNMAFADIVGFIQPGALEGVAGPGGVQITQELLLVFALFIEIPLAMIFVSRILKRGAANRWANTVAAVITSVFVVGGGSMELPFYAFFAAVEVACMALIVWSVWSRRSVGTASLQPVG